MIDEERTADSLLAADALASVADNQAAIAPARAETGKRSLLDYLGLGVRGFMMGASDVVPGVSGGTMALILGIYEELVESIRAVGQRDFLGAVVRLRWRDALAALNWPFLAAVGAGIALAVLTLARGLEWLLQSHPVLLWSFFFGLVLASGAVVSRRVERWSLPLGLVTLAAAAGAYLIVGLVPARTPDQPWFLFLSGALAICAMILPGISGAFILVLLGKYEFALAALNRGDVVSIGLIGLGAGVGLVTFAQLLGWLLKRHHNLTIAALTGLMLGSLRKLWPWKVDAAWIYNVEGEAVPVVQNNILPELSIAGALNPEVVYAALLALVGFGLVLTLTWVAKRIA